MRTIACFLILLFISGCGNFNPKSRINNSKGKIEELNNNQNGMMLELGKLKQDTDILNSKLKEIQQGLINLNAAISRNENTGVQVLQGDGALFLVFSCFALVLIFYYKNKNTEEVAKIMAEKIIESGDENLQKSIVEAAVKNNKEENILKILKNVKSL